MTRPFSDFSLNDLYNIERLLDNISRLPLVKRPDIRKDFALIECSNSNAHTYNQYIQALQTPILSIIISNNFSVKIVGLNNNQIQQLYTSEINNYLQQNNFI